MLKYAALLRGQRIHFAYAVHSASQSMVAGMPGRLTAMAKASLVAVSAWTSGTVQLQTHVVYLQTVVMQATSMLSWCLVIRTVLP